MSENTDEAESFLQEPRSDYRIRTSTAYSFLSIAKSLELLCELGLMWAKPITFTTRVESDPNVAGAEIPITEVTTCCNGNVPEGHECGDCGCFNRDDIVHKCGVHNRA